jgi:2-polyprenyl-3-methyl-5-hydroxy-6-metoxy-1,4-benzoquinol methylase
MDHTDPLPSRLDAARLLWRLYETATFPQRTLAALRPFICPLSPVLEQIPPGARVLDIGSGNGLFLSAMASVRTIAVGYGAEVSARAIEAAQTVARKQRLPLQFKEASEPAEWPQGAVDVVTMIDVMHHLPQEIRQTFVEAAAARLAPGGRFVYKDMDKRPGWRALWNNLHDLLLAREWVRLEPSANVRNWALNAGLRQVSGLRYSACGLYGHELLVFERER